MYLEYMRISKGKILWSFPVAHFSKVSHTIIYSVRTWLDEMLTSQAQLENVLKEAFLLGRGHKMINLSVPFGIFLLNVYLSLSIQCKK